MLIAHLIDDLKQHDGQLPVLLASRPSTGSQLAQNEAQVKAFGEVLIDVVGSDVDIRPTNDGPGLVVGQVRIPRDPGHRSAVMADSIAP